MVIALTQVRIRPTLVLQLDIFVQPTQQKQRCTSASLKDGVKVASTAPSARKTAISAWSQQLPSVRRATLETCAMNAFKVTNIATNALLVTTKLNISVTPPPSLFYSSSQSSYRVYLLSVSLLHLYTTITYYSYRTTPIPPLHYPSTTSLLLLLHPVLYTYFLGSIKYGRAVMDCVVCPVEGQNEALFILMCVAVVVVSLGLLAYHLYKAMKGELDKTHEEEEKSYKIVSKITMNSIQFNLLAVGVGFAFPGFVRDLLSALSLTTGDAGENAVFNMDCFLRSPDGLAPKIQEIYAIFIVPFVLIVGFLGVLGVSCLISKLRRGVIPWEQYLTALYNHTTFVLFFFHPTLTTAFFEIFNCVPVSKTAQYLAADMGVQCWKGEHRNVAIYTGMFGTFWVFVCPVVGAVLLVNNRVVIQVPYTPLPSPPQPYPTLPSTSLPHRASLPPLPSTSSILFPPLHTTPSLPALTANAKATR